MLRRRTLRSLRESKSSRITDRKTINAFAKMITNISNIGKFAFLKLR
jgi:hypothetical protein